MKSNKLELTFLETSYGPEDWGKQLSCPFCGDAFVHFRQPRYCTRDGTGDWVEHGHFVGVPLFCENGHDWVLHIGFHKGHSFLKVIKIPPRG